LFALFVIDQELSQRGRFLISLSSAVLKETRKKMFEKKKKWLTKSGNEVELSFASNGEKQTSDL
jgi:hypothetical protein